MPSQVIDVLCRNATASRANVSPAAPLSSTVPGPASARNVIVFVDDAPCSGGTSTDSE